MKKKLAVIINGDLSINRQGQLNSAISRVKHLKQLDVYDIDVFCIQEYDFGLLRRIHCQKRIVQISQQVVDGITVNVVYKKNLLIDTLFEKLLHISPLYSTFCYHKIAKMIKGYDMVVGHSSLGGLMAYYVREHNDTPYCVVWHGSDIHTLPVNNKRTKELTRRTLKNSSGNFFVSRSLLNTAMEVFGDVPYPHISYNAPGEEFVRYTDERRAELRQDKGVYGKSVVAFAGNLVPVKNVFTLPGIYKRIKEHCGNVAFWIIGDGPLREPLMNKMVVCAVECKFWGNQQPENMPDFMNCIDVLVLPSKNESFGMVLVEAISCGANVVGSNCGGIPEVIGKENCFEMDDMFEENISERIIYMLKNKVVQRVNSEFDWHKTAKNEVRQFTEILNH